jgi:hypothetical protein
MILVVNFLKIFPPKIINSLKTRGGRQKYFGSALLVLLPIIQIFVLKESFCVKNFNARLLTYNIDFRIPKILFIALGGFNLL